jgi:hypothetical protein
MKQTYVIGPSHIHSDYTWQIGHELYHKILFKDCILDAHRGLPVWSRYIYDKIKEQSALGNNICWIVSDYKFNNHNYNQLATMIGKDELFLNEMGYFGNVSRDLMDEHHIELLGKHSIKVMDYILSEFPHVKLIFWCLYKRTKANSNSSYPKHLWYDEIKEKYKNNIIDIDQFTTPEDFNSKIIDEGAHPNRDGFILLDRMIQSAFQ